MSFNTWLSPVGEDLLPVRRAKRPREAEEFVDVDDVLVEVIDDQEHLIFGEDEN